MDFDCHPEQTPEVERGAVRRRHDADLALRDHDGLRDRNAEQVRVNGPQSRWQRPHLDALYAALFDERDRVLKVVVRVLRAVGGENSARRQRLAVNRLDHANLVGAYLDQRRLLHHAFEGPFDVVQSRFQHVSLDADLSFGGYHAAWRHPRPGVAALLDRNLLRADVDHTFGYQEQQSE